MKIQKKPHTSLRSGFSLVEVTIAVAIAALGFVTLLGLLPAGINMAKDSAQMSTGARIIQKLSGEMQFLAWEDINWTGYSPLRYFTSEGTEITAAEMSSPDELASMISYVASVQLPDQPLDVILPGAGVGAQKPSEYLRRMRICVATTNDPAFNFSSAPPMRVTSVTALVARTGIN